MPGVRFAVSISHNRLFGTRSLGLCRTAASSRVSRSTSDMESPKLSRRARRRLPAVWVAVGIVRRKLPQRRRSSYPSIWGTRSRSDAPPDGAAVRLQRRDGAIAGLVGSGDGAAGWPQRLCELSETVGWGDVAKSPPEAAGQAKNAGSQADPVKCLPVLRVDTARFDHFVFPRTMAKLMIAGRSLGFKSRRQLGLNAMKPA